jgi:hypothetical protein
MVRARQRLPAHRGQQPAEVLTAWAARAPVRRDARVSLLRRGVRSHQVDVDVESISMDEQVGRALAERGQPGP